MPNLNLNHCFVAVKTSSSNARWSYYAEIDRVKQEDVILRRNDLVAEMNKYLFECLNSGPAPDDLKCVITETWSK